MYHVYCLFTLPLKYKFGEGYCNIDEKFCVRERNQISWQIYSIKTDRTMSVELSASLLCRSFHFGSWEIKNLQYLKTESNKILIWQFSPSPEIIIGPLLHCYYISFEANSSSLFLWETFSLIFPVRKWDALGSITRHDSWFSL